MDKCYVYIYLDSSKPGHYLFNGLEFEYEPIYIGKGTGYRANSHFPSCLNKKVGSYNSLFYNKLRKLLKNNSKPIVSIYKDNLPEADAHSIEIDLIKKIGRRVSKEGPLYNISIGGEGSSGSVSRGFKIVAYNKNGTKAKEFKSAREASKETGISVNRIYKQCSGWNENSREKYRFRKASDKIIALDNIENGIFVKRKTVYQYDLEGNFIREWKNATEASKNLKDVGRSSINNNLLGRSKKCRKYIFSYKKKEKI